MQNKFLAVGNLNSITVQALRLNNF